MIDRTEIELIRILHFENHLSIRQIARMLKRSRNTIERWLKNPEPAPKKLISNRVFLENHRSEIEDLFLECELNCLPLQRAIKEKFGEVISFTATERSVALRRKLCLPRTKGKIWLLI